MGEYFLDKLYPPTLPPLLSLFKNKFFKIEILKGKNWSFFAESGGGVTRKTKYCIILLFCQVDIFV